MAPSKLHLPFVAFLLIGGTAYSGDDFSTWSLARKEQFLATATINAPEYAGKGITKSEKVMLSDGVSEHAAHVQSIDIYTPLFKGKDGSREQDFKDSWKFDVAAYRLAKLLNLTDMVPVCVARVVDGKPSSLDWWVDGVLMDEKERKTTNIEPPDGARWRGQMDTIRIFDQLIYNMDRSEENLLITKNWDVWMIDHSRAFRKWTSLRNAAAVTHCRPDLQQALKKLKRAEVVTTLGDLLTVEEINGLMARRDLIVAKLEGRGDGIAPPASQTAASTTKTSKR